MIAIILYITISKWLFLYNIAFNDLYFRYHIWVIDRLSLVSEMHFSRILKEDNPIGIDVECGENNKFRDFGHYI